MTENVGKVPVNDGGGLLDSPGMINSLIVDCNNLPALLVQGKYVGFCSQIVQMVQKLGLLREGVEKDMAFLQKRITELEEIIDKGVEADVQR